MAPPLRVVRVVAMTVLLIALAACQTEAGEDGEPHEQEPAQTEVYNAAALAPWLDAAAGAQDRRADVLLVGDSILEGLGSEWEGRPATLLQDKLREAFPLKGPQAAGYLPAGNHAALVPPWVTAGGALPLTTFGLGLKALGLGQGQTITHQGDFRRVRLWFGVEPGLAAPGSVSIDGAPPQVMSPTEARTGSGLSWDSGDLGPGQHQVTVGGGGDGLPLALEAIEEFASKDDMDHGIHVYDGAHSGFDSRAFLNDLPAVSHMWEAAEVLDADVTVIHLGINDRSVNVSAEQLAANITELADRAAAAADDAEHPVLVVVPYQIPRLDVQGEQDPQWDDIRARLIDLAHDNIAVIDLDASWPDLAFGEGADTGLMLEDEMPVHPNSAGHRRLAEIMSEVLTGS